MGQRGGRTLHTTFANFPFNVGTGLHCTRVCIVAHGNAN